MDFNWKKKAVPFAVFFVVANPATFKAVRSIAGSWVASADGVPTAAVSMASGQAPEASTCARIP
jgi:hypothetical protein